MELWQWTGFMFVILLAFAISWAVIWFFNRAARKLIARVESPVAEPMEYFGSYFGAFSLDVEMLAYVPTTNWAEFLAIREDLFLRMMEIVTESGTSFAFPSHTSYLCRDPGLDRDAGRAAVDRVQEWREREELPFPFLTDQRIAELEGTLDYPPHGSASASESESN